MPMTPDAMERKVSQLDNDVQAIYEMISAVDGTLRRHENRFKEISAQLGDLHLQLTEHRARLDAIDARLGAIGTHLDAVDGKLDAVDGKLDAVLDLLRHSGGHPA